MKEYTDLPNARQALRAKHGRQIVYLARRVSRKLYRCPYCTDMIQVGESHVVVRYITAEPKSHRHGHFRCVHTALLPHLSRIEIIDSNDAAPTALNRRARRKRAQARRRGLR